VRDLGDVSLRHWQHPRRHLAVAAAPNVAATFKLRIDYPHSQVVRANLGLVSRLPSIRMLATRRLRLHRVEVRVK